MDLPQLADYLTFKNENVSLFLGDSFSLLPHIPNETFDMIFADPPYFLSSGGITCKSGKMESVDKGDWDKSHSWRDMDEFNYVWLKECKRLLKKDGTIWVSGTMHNIFSVGSNLQKLEYKLLNNITWQKTNPPPNLSCRMFTHSTENIIWAKKDEKSKQLFNYSLMKEINNGKQMKDVWSFSIINKSEKKLGNHPTQKPLALLERIILASTNPEDLIFDPFIGSGTTAVAASELNRRCIGIDIEKDYLQLAQRRLENIKQVSFDI